MMRRHRALVGYHHFALAPTGVDPVPDPSRPWELIQVSTTRDYLLVSTGITDGPIWLTLTESAPDDDNWDVFDKAWMNIDDDLHYVAPVSSDAVGDHPSFVPSSPGRHLVTVMARGVNLRQNEFLDAEEEPVEEYLIWFRSMDR